MQVVKSISPRGAVSCQSSILFVNGEGGDAHLLCLSPSSGYSVEKFHTINSWSESRILRETSLEVDCGADIPSLQEDLLAKEMLSDDSVILDSLAPVHDSLLISDEECSSDYQLLLACGNAPNGLLCRYFPLC